MAVGGLGLALLLHISASSGAVPYQLSRLGHLWLDGAADVVSTLGTATSQWAGYALAAALVGYLLFALHLETRSRRVAAYPLVATAWILVLLPTTVFWARAVASLQSPPDPGRPAALAAVGLLLAVLTGAALLLLGRWWVLRRRLSADGADRDEAAAADATDSHDPLGVARGMGTVGLAFWILVGACVLRVSLSGSLPEPGALPLLPRAVGQLAMTVERTKLFMAHTGHPGLAAGLLAGISALGLFLHVIARREVRWARVGLLVYWSAVVLAAMVGAGYVLSLIPFGRLGAGALLAVVLVGTILVRAIVALACAHSWLPARRKPS
jgi:hypothetical protein